jgi:hypothetical protein
MALEDGADGLPTSSRVSAKQGQSRVVGYDDLEDYEPLPPRTTQGEREFRATTGRDYTEVDKAQPGANVPLTQTDPNAEYLRTLAGKGYGNPADNTDNAPYLDRLKKLGYGFDTPNKSNVMNMVNDFMYEATKQVFVYPEDLGSNPELLNWIQIEMYETGGYGIQSQQKDSTTDIMGFDIAKSQTAEKLRNNLNTLGGIAATNIIGYFTIGGNATQVLVSGMGAKLGKGLWNNFSYEPQFGTQQFGFAQETTGFTTANKRVNKTICLYMPTSLKTSYGVEYNEEDFSALVDVVSKVKVTAQTVSNLIKGAPQNESTAALLRGVSDTAARQALAGANKQLSSLATPLSGGEDLKLDKAYNALSRQVINPFIINMYKSTKRRGFDFTFRFLPRSRQEVAAVYSIITTLKKYALPKRAADKAGRLIEYPAEFKIRFYHNGVENQFLPKIARCALKDVSLIYGDEPFTTFAPVEGFGAAPTKIDMTLSFEELEILTQDRVDQGY